jgi:hypothetical protein
MNIRGGLSIKLVPRFISEYQSLSIDMRRETDACISEFRRDPLPNARRPHVVTFRGVKPMIFTMDVTKNKAYKLSFIIKGKVAVLLRVGTHKVLNRDPGYTEAKVAVNEAAK